MRKETAAFEGMGAIPKKSRENRGHVKYAFVITF